MTLDPGDHKLSFDTPFVPIGAISKEEFENNRIFPFVFYLYRLRFPLKTVPTNDYGIYEILNFFKQDFSTMLIDNF